MKCRSCGAYLKENSVVCPWCLGLASVGYKLKLESIHGGLEMYNRYRVAAWLGRLILLCSLIFLGVFVSQLNEIGKGFVSGCGCFVGIVLSSVCYTIKDYLRSAIDSLLVEK